jgi:hypothetical protein
MTLFEKLVAIYPELSEKDFGALGSIRLQNDSDGKGDYIAEWNHPTYPKPTEEQLG